MRSRSDATWQALRDPPSMAVQTIDVERDMTAGCPPHELFVTLASRPIIAPSRQGSA
jgi:hypothetical protein